MGASSSAFATRASCRNRVFSAHPTRAWLRAPEHRRPRVAWMGTPWGHPGLFCAADPVSQNARKSAELSRFPNKVARAKVASFFGGQGGPFGRKSGGDPENRGDRPPRRTSARSGATPIGGHGACPHRDRMGTEWGHRPPILCPGFPARRSCKSAISRRFGESADVLTAAFFRCPRWRFGPENGG